MLRHPLSISRQALSTMALACILVVLAQPGPRAQPHDRGLADPEFQELVDPGFRVIPLREAAQIAQGRFRGRLIAARLTPPSPQERARGVELVHELRLLTARRDVLLIRLDARDGAFLEVAGSGLAQARRRNGDSE